MRASGNRVSKATSRPAERPARSGPSGWSRILIESALIVFSILLALFVDELRENRRLDVLRDRAVADIHEELEQNLASVQRALPYHTAVRDSLGRLLQALDRTAGPAAFELLGVIAPSGLVPPDIRDAAWQTAISTDAIALIDYSSIHRLAGTYDTQASGVKATIARMQDFIFDPMLFEPERTAAALRLMFAMTQELVGQEAFLSDLYGRTLEDPAFAGLETGARTMPDSAASAMD